MRQVSPHVIPTGLHGARRSRPSQETAHGKCIPWRRQTRVEGSHSTRPRRTAVTPVEGLGRWPCDPYDHCELSRSLASNRNVQACPDRWGFRIAHSATANSPAEGKPSTCVGRCPRTQLQWSKGALGHEARTVMSRHLTTSAASVAPVSVLSVRPGYDALTGRGIGYGGNEEAVQVLA